MDSPPAPEPRRLIQSGPWTQGVIVIDNFAVAVFWVGGMDLVFESTTWTVNGNVPAVVAFPEITPFELSFNPVGSTAEPGASDHL